LNESLHHLSLSAQDFKPEFFTLGTV